MKVVVAKVNEVLFEGEAQSLTVPAVAGEMTVLGHHMPLVTTLKAGEIILRTEGEEKQYPIESGVLEVTPEGATVIL
jgi:F-type H+-transporting ATPase subunit epsilon